MTERRIASRLTAEEAVSLASAAPDAWTGRIAVLSTAIPREEVNVPICLVQPPGDEAPFDDPADPTRKYWLPRYRLAEEMVSGRPRYQIRFVEQAGVWRLRLRLTPVPPPGLEAVAAACPILPHVVKLQLSYGLLGAAATRKTATFQEIRQSDEAVDADLVLSGLAQRDETLAALRDPARAAQLVIRRKAEVALEETRGGGEEAGLVAMRPGRLPFDKIGPAQQFRPIRPVIDVRPERPGPDLVLRPGRPIVLEPLRPQRPVRLPAPRLSFVRAERHVVRGAEFVRYLLSIDNWADFADEFFAPSPDLPPCGANANAARSWVDILDGVTGARLYGFCALGGPRDLTQLWFAREAGTPAPALVRVRVTDRRRNVAQESNDVAIVDAPPAPPGFRIVAIDLDQTAEPEPFAFSPELHGYVFEGLTGGGAPTQGGLVRLQEASHVYFQEAAEPSRILYLPDDFRIARRSGDFRKPFMTLRVRTTEGSADGAQVALDFAVAPYADPARLAAARTALAARVRVDPAALTLQPLVTQQVRFFVQRPTATDRVELQRPADARLLQGPLFDTLSMPLKDFMLAFDAMLGRTAGLFGGRVEIDVEGWGPQIRPFVVDAAALAGAPFDIEAVESGAGLTLRLRNAVESPIALRDATLLASRGGVSAMVALDGELVVGPGETAEFAATAPVLPGSGAIRFDLAGGVVVQPSDVAVLDAILDRSTVEFYREIDVRVTPSIFEAPPGLPASELITSVVVDFEGGGSTELTRLRPSRSVRIDYPFDDVILRNPIQSGYRYVKTVFYQTGEPVRDPSATAESSEILHLAVARRSAPPP